MKTALHHGSEDHDGLQYDENVFARKIELPFLDVFSTLNLMLYQNFFTEKNGRIWFTLALFYV